ncbi:MAG: ferritin [Rhodothermales bacterium]|nr:ferritin [Rhodothermales bacterium]MBO6778768.1 ferritin [Rhodothermales bacterium]
MKQKVVEAVNRQIREEFQSSYIYLAMSARFEALKLPGAAAWMRNQAREEVMHAMKFFDFLIRRGENPVLEGLEAPTVSFDNILDAFEQSLAHEQHITKCIHDLYEVAQAERDYPLQTLLHWFIDEQVEEEENAEGIIDSIRLAGQAGEALFMIDRELGLREPEDEEA